MSGSPRTATRVTPGAICLSSSSHFPLNAHRKQLRDESRPRSKARRPPQLHNLPKDELHNRILLHHTECRASLLWRSISALRSLSVTASRVAEKALPALTCDSYLGVFAAAAIAIFISTVS